jgi:hypothetical protein
VIFQHRVPVPQHRTDIVADVDDLEARSLPIVRRVAVDERRLFDSGARAVKLDSGIAGMLLIDEGAERAYFRLRAN